MDAFRTGMIVSALLMIGGGLLAAAGIENPRRDEPAVAEQPAPASA